MQFAVAPPQTCPQACPAGQRSQPEQELWVLERDPHGVGGLPRCSSEGLPISQPSQGESGQPWHQDGPADPLLPLPFPPLPGRTGKSTRARPARPR